MAKPCVHWKMYVPQNLMGRQIYKDECAKCFHTPKHEQGLNLCLTCLQGFCNVARPTIDHTTLHYNLTNCSAQDQHPLYMNIKMVRKPDDPAESKEITKLAIGKPGGVDPEQDKYDRVVKVSCLSCKIDEISLENPEVLLIVNSILLA